MDRIQEESHKLGIWGDRFKPYAASRQWEDDTETLETRDWAFNRHSMNLPMVDEEGHRHEGIGNVSPFDNGVVSVGLDNIEVRLIQGLPPTFMNVIAKATRATIGIEPGRDEDDDRDAEEMMKGGLQTALEDAVLVFEVRGVSRTCTHQLVRTRKAAFHQQSQRASYMGDLPEVRMPESIWRNERARIAFLSALAETHRAYRIAAEEDIAYQDARFILPEGTNNYILLEYPLRTFIDTYNYRGCFMFQWEIGHVMREARRALVEEIPWIGDYVKISCERTPGAKDADAVLADFEEQTGEHRDAFPVPEMITHTCTFQGWESVEGQCPFPWARDSNRTYQPREDLLIKRKEAAERHPSGRDLAMEEARARVLSDPEGDDDFIEEMSGVMSCPSCGGGMYLWTRPVTGSKYRLCTQCDYKEDV